MSEDKQVGLEHVTLDIRTAIAGGALIISGVVATLAGVYSNASDLRHEMIELESRWVDRVASIESRIRKDLVDLRKDIPPPEVRQRFDFMEERIRKLEGNHG